MNELWLVRVSDIEGNEHNGSERQQRLNMMKVIRANIN
jgi:hypothetical protein